MPLISVQTNLTRSKIPDNFLTDVTKEAAAILAVGEKSIQLLVNTDCLMAFSGTTEPNAAVTVFAVGQLGPDKNEAIIAKLTALLTSKLNIQKERMYLLLHALASSDVGYMGTPLTFFAKAKK